MRQMNKKRQIQTSILFSSFILCRILSAPQITQKKFPGPSKFLSQATPPLFPEEYQEKSESLVRAKKKLESEFLQMKRNYKKEKCTLESTIFSLRQQLKQLRREAAPAYSQYLQVTQYVFKNDFTFFLLPSF